MTDDGYEYDEESEGMREALERARAAPRTEEDFDETAERLELMSSDPTSEFPDEPPDDSEMVLPELDFTEADAGPPPTSPPEEEWARIQRELRENKTRVPPDDSLAARMKEVGWDPAKSPRTMRDTDWEQLQQDVEDAERAAETSQTVGAMLHAAAPGFTAPGDAGQGRVRAARSALESARNRERTDRQRDVDGFNQATTLARLKGTERANADLAAQRRAEADRRRTADERADERARTDSKARADRQHTLDDAEQRSLEAERRIILSDPRAKRFGLTADGLAGLDRKGLEGVRRELGEKMPADQQRARAVKPGDYSAVPEDIRGRVRQIVEGRGDVPKGRVGERILSYVTQIDPNFDATRFAAYKKVREQQATGKDVVAIDVALEHLATARNLIPQNASPQFVNRLKQAIASGTGDAQFKPFIAASTVAAHELAKVYGIEDQAGKAMVERQLEAAQSPEQLAAVFDTFIELVEGKQKGLVRQRERVAPRGQTVKMKFPNGKVLDVPAAEVDEAKREFKAVQFNF